MIDEYVMLEVSISTKWNLIILKKTNKQTSLAHHMCGISRLKRGRFGEGEGRGVVIRVVVF